MQSSMYANDLQSTVCVVIRDTDTGTMFLHVAKGEMVPYILLLNVSRLLELR